MSKFHCTQPFPFSTPGTAKNFYLDTNHFKLQQFSKMHERALWSLISLTCLIMKSDNLPTVIKSDNLPMGAAFCCFYINPSLLVPFHNERVQACRTACICLLELTSPYETFTLNPLSTKKTTILPRALPLPGKTKKRMLTKKETKQIQENSDQGL